MWHIFFIMWVSWSWKWTLIWNLKKLNLEKLSFPLTYKTREIRKNEINWVDSFFISKEEFFNSISNQEFLEYAVVHETDYYWTKKKDIFEEWIEKWKIVIKELDINWLIELRKNYPELDSKYTTIFLNIPENILKQRILQRWAFMSDDELKRRINSSIFEEEKANELCNFVIDASVWIWEVFEKVFEIIKTKL